MAEVLKDIKKTKPRRKGKKSVIYGESFLACRQDTSPVESVNIDYVYESPNIPDNSNIYAEFQSIFDRFEALQQEKEDAKQLSSEPSSSNLENVAIENDLLAEAKSQSESENEEDEIEISKKKARKLYRMTIAELKTHVARPEVVEWVDVTAKDPIFLCNLKSVKNTIPVPPHWSQKRKFLLGKRGIEKPPFELPGFIRDTGITEQRNLMQRQEDAKSFKTKTRERLQPKMGKINLDYEKLHDAFFKFQTKPKMTSYGELYFEGKEFEVKAFHKKPGYLSEVLRDALSMTSRLTPPPWLINMQRVGPPASYPYLRIPGVNAPLPDGASWGYQPGGWGKAPVDEFNRPLYGDVFGVHQQQNKAAADATKQLLDAVDRSVWGEITVEDLGIDEDIEELPEENELDEGEDEQLDKHQPSAPVPIASLDIDAQPTFQAHNYLDLQREAKKAIDMELGTQSSKSLYSILPQKESNKLGSGILPSQHTYQMLSGGRAAAHMEVSIDPTELNDVGELDPQTLAARYEANLAATASALPAGMSMHVAKEDLSGMVAQHLQKQQQSIQEKKKKKQDVKEYKF